MTTSPATVSPPRKIPSQVFVTGLSDVRVRADVADIGQGRPMVFLHGLVGLNEHWNELSRLVSARARCLMLQLPLLDLTGDDCSIDGVTELTIRFLERQVREPSVVVGNSFGGHVALRIALDRPDLIRGLVLAGSAGLIERTTVNDVQIRPSREWLEDKIGELFFDRTKMRASDVDRAFVELSDRRHARAMVKLSRTARRNHLGDQIARIKTPTLLIWGRQDVVTPPEACEELLTKIKNSRAVWLDNCGHAPMLECPEAFGEALCGFAAELDRRA
jgi:2-hydroxy-6-oxonona-2,4-dienedioate hydrolase